MNQFSLTPTTEIDVGAFYNRHATRARVNNARLKRKIASVCKMLKPFQSLEYDLQRGIITIITELIVPANDPAQVADILANRAPEEKVIVRRFADSYKVLLTKQLNI